MSVCASCGGPLPAQSGRGRPRKFCVECVPRVREAGKATVSRLWRETNPGRVDAYNEGRRQHPRVPGIDVSEMNARLRADADRRRRQAAA